MMKNVSVDNLVNNMIDLNNSTDTPILAESTYTGAATDVTLYNSVVVILKVIMLLIAYQLLAF